MKSVLQDWVMELPLRHQGVLLTAVRGPDGSSKEDPVKALVRAMRCAFLNCYCVDPRKARSFIEYVGGGELQARMLRVQRSHDHLYHHYLMHLIHAAEVIGYKHPDLVIRDAWRVFYYNMCNKLHVYPESEEQMDLRLCADETEFAEA